MQSSLESLALSPEFVSSVNQSDPARRRTEAATASRGPRPRGGRKAANRRARDRCKGRDERGITYREERGMRVEWRERSLSE